MDRRDRADNDHGEAGRCQPRQEPQNESEAADGFSDDDQKGHNPGQMHGSRKEPHGPGKTVSPEPAQELLRAVRKHHNRQHHPKDQTRPGLISLKQCLHGIPLG